MASKTSSNRDSIATEIYRLIRAGELVPGERLDQVDLCRRFEVSRTPLREALHSLTTEGVLRHTPNQGWYISRLERSELEELYAIRTYLDSMLLKSVEWPDEQEFGRLVEAHQKSVCASEKHDIEGMNEGNEEFRFTLYSWSPLKVFYREASRLWRVSMPYRSVLLSKPEYVREIIESHAAMVECVRARDSVGLLTITDAARVRTRDLLTAALRDDLTEAHTELPQRFTELSMNEWAASTGVKSDIEISWLT